MYEQSIYTLFIILLFYRVQLAEEGELRSGNETNSFQSFIKHEGFKCVVWGCADDGVVLDREALC